MPDGVAGAQAGPSQASEIQISEGGSDTLGGLRSTAKPALRPALKQSSRRADEASSSDGAAGTGVGAPVQKRARSIAFGAAVHPEPRSNQEVEMLLTTSNATSNMSHKSRVSFAGTDEELHSGISDEGSPSKELLEPPMASTRVAGKPRSQKARFKSKFESMKKVTRSLTRFMVRQPSNEVLSNRANRTTDNLLNLGFCVPREGRARRRPRAINPESSILMVWDMWLMMTNVVIGLITPYQVGHDWDGVGLGLEFWFNRHADFIYILDLILVFNLAYFDTKSGLWVFELPKIRRKYLRGWFTFDCLTCIPYDLIMYFLWRNGDLAMGVEGTLRLLRLLRVGRLLKSTRIPHRMTWLISLDFSLLQLLKYILYAILFAHWIACAWSLVVVIERNRADNWVEIFFGVTVMELAPFDLYIGSLYWSVMTVSTIGYGDVLPVTTPERVFVILAMLMGAFAYGYIIGAVSGIVSTRDAKKNAFYSTMDGLNNFMELSKLPQTLRIKLREYFTYRCNNSIDVQGSNQLLQAMSPALRSDVAMFVNGSWIANVPHFKKCEPVFITQVALHMNHVVFPPAETIVEVGERLDHLYIVKRGIAVGRGRLFTTGKVFGEESLYKMGEASFTVRSLTFTDVTYITYDAFMELLENFPESEVQFRKAAIRALFHEEVMAYCQAYRNLQEEQKELQVMRSYSRSAAEETLDVSGEDRSQFSSYDSILEPAVLPNRATSSFLKSDAAHRRVQFYERKLRMFIMVSDLEKLRYNRCATIIQRAWRKYMRRRQEEEARKADLLSSFMSDLVTGIQPADDAAPAALSKSRSMAARGSAVEPLSQSSARLRPTMSATPSSRAASRATSGKSLLEDAEDDREEAEGERGSAGTATASFRRAEDEVWSGREEGRTLDIRRNAPLPPVLAHPTTSAAAGEGDAAYAKKLSDIEDRMAAFHHEMRMMKQAVQLTALEMTMGDERRTSRGVKPFSTPNSGKSAPSTGSKPASAGGAHQRSLHP